MELRIDMTLMAMFPFLRELTPFTMLLRFLTACICGGVVGYSRGNITVRPVFEHMYWYVSARLPRS